jgi:glycosyltransferase involved in cell wall biosynthesis
MKISVIVPVYNVENYQMQDLLGIADILYGTILPVLDGESR